jgi:Zn-dependent protease
MLGLLTSNPFAFLITALGLVVAVTVHEFAHAFMADRLGDPTPRAQGRLTLNPLAHLDPVGTITLLLVGFGWGKPVQFDPYNLKHQARDAALISLAGPASNIILAIILSLLIHFVFPGNALLNVIFAHTLIINLSLAIFNLVPIAPLDGEKILYALLPRLTAIEYRQFMRQYGMIVLLLLILPIFGGRSPVSQLISPIIDFLATLLLGGF